MKRPYGDIEDDVNDDGRVPDEIDDHLLGLKRQPYFGLFASDRTTRHVRPETIMQALMEQAPGDSLDESLEEAQPIIDAIALAQAAMTPEDLYVLDAINAEAVSFTILGERLGIARTSAFRIHKRALARLRALLLSNPQIRERLDMEPTWNSAAMAELIEIAGLFEGWPEGAVCDLSGTVFDIKAAIDDAVHVGMEEGRENAAIQYLVHAAECAVIYLRSVGKWNVLNMHDLLVSKQHDYGHENILTFGVVGVLVRCADKAARLVNVAGNRELKPRNEALIDTFVDIVGYAVIARMLKQETFEYELDTERD